MSHHFYFTFYIFLFFSLKGIPSEKLNDINVSKIDFHNPLSCIEYCEIYKTRKDLTPFEFDDLKIHNNDLLERGKQKSSQGISDSFFWVSFIINWNSNDIDNLLLEINKSQLDEILLYEKTTNGYSLIGEGGDKDRTFYDRTILNRRYIFPLKNTSKKTCYLLKIENINKSVSFPLLLWSKDQFKTSEQKQNLFYIGYFGIALFLSFLAMLTGIIIKKKIFCIYSLYVIVLCFYISWTLGFTFKFIYPDIIGLNNNLRFLLMPLGNILAIEFIILLLFTKEHSPQLTKLFRYTQYLFAVMIILWFTFPHFYKIYQLEMLYVHYSIFPIIFINLNISAFRALKNHSRKALLFFSSILFLLIGLFCSLFIEIGFLQKSLFGICPVMIGFALEITMLSIAMVLIFKDVLKSKSLLLQESVEFHESKKELITENIELRKEINELIKETRNTKQEENITKNVLLKSKTVIKLDDLCHISSNGRYLEFYIVGKQNPEIDRNTLKNILQELPENFIQTHRSHIVNLDFTRSLNNNELFLKSGNTLPVSRSFKAQLLDRLQRV